MSIRKLASGFESGRYKPIQAYIDQGVLKQFKLRYPTHGDITRMIRNAFVVAISEDELTEEAAQHAVRTLLPHAPETTTTELPCSVCVYPAICVSELSCAVAELERKIDLARDLYPLDTPDENG